MKIGDRVKIVHYVSPFWISKKRGGDYPLFPIIAQDNDFWACDMNKEFLGQMGVIKEITETQGKLKYSLEGTTITSWYNQEQLELVQ